MRAYFRSVPIVLVAGFCLAVFPGGFRHAASAANGQTVFDNLHCSSCHKPTEKTVAVPLSQIAKTYGAADNLVKFFKGETKPVVESEKPGMMKGQMPKLGALSDEDKQALADYVLSFK